MIAGLLYSPAWLAAQPAGISVPPKDRPTSPDDQPDTEGNQSDNNQPDPRRSDPTAKDSGLAPSSTETGSAGGEPAPIQDGSVITGGGPTAAGGTPIPITGAHLVPSAPATPWSKGVSLETRKAASDLFEEGNRLFKIPLFGQAIEKYVAALRLWKHPAFYFNLAVAQLNISQEVEARESLEHAIAHGAEPLGEAQFEEARKQLEQVTRQLARIRLHCRTPGAEVTLDGATVLVGPGSYEGWIKAKSHDLTAKKPGYQSEARQVTVSSGKLLNVDLSLLTLAQAVAAGTSRRWAVWKPWAVIGAGIAIAGGGGGGVHARAARNFNVYDREFSILECTRPMNDGCDETEIPSWLNRRLIWARQQQIIAVGSYVAGGSLLVTGVLLLYLNRPRLMEQKPHSFSRSIALTPAISRDLLGVLINVTH